MNSSKLNINNSSATTHTSLEHDIQHLLALAPTSREIASYEVADMHGISIEEIEKMIKAASTKQ